MKWIFFLLQGEIKQLTWNKNTTFSIVTVCRHTRAYAYDVVIPRVQETKSQNTATQRYCGLHSHGFSEWRRSGCFHRWQRYQVGNYRQKWRHIPLLRVRRTLLLQLFNSDLFPLLFFFFHFFLFFRTNSHTTLAKNQGAGGSSRWCRACRGKTGETCNPEADLERGTLTKDIGATVSHHLCFQSYASLILELNWTQEHNQTRHASEWYPILSNS